VWKRPRSSVILTQPVIPGWCRRTTGAWRIESGNGASRERCSAARKARDSAGRVGLYGRPVDSLTSRRATWCPSGAGRNFKGIVGQILGHSLEPAAIGAGVGLVALALARLIAGLLYKLSPANPATFAPVPPFLLAIAFVVLCARAPLNTAGPDCGADGRMTLFKYWPLQKSRTARE
jgi:hypothetical protein